MTCGNCHVALPELGGPCSIGEHQFCTKHCRDKWALANIAAIDAERARLRRELVRIFTRCRRGTLAFELARAALFPSPPSPPALQPTPAGEP